MENGIWNDRSTKLINPSFNWILIMISEHVGDFSSGIPSYSAQLREASNLQHKEEHHLLISIDHSRRWSVYMHVDVDTAQLAIYRVNATIIIAKHDYVTDYRANDVDVPG